MKKLAIQTCLVMLRDDEEEKNKEKGRRKNELSFHMNIYKKSPTINECSLPITLDENCPIPSSIFSQSLRWFL
jgi:hypothetical protein